MTYDSLQSVLAAYVLNEITVLNAIEHTLELYTRFPDQDPLWRMLDTAEASLPAEVFDLVTFASLASIYRHNITHVGPLWINLVGGFRVSIWYDTTTERFHVKTEVRQKSYSYASAHFIHAFSRFLEAARAHELATVAPVQ
jgi:hypothetical protein